jgi:polysaccharide export outer membrane protein
MPIRFVLIFVSASTLIFAQSEAAAPPGAAAKVTLPPAPPDAGAAQPTQPQAPSAAADSTQTAPTPAAESAAVLTPKPTAAKRPSTKPEKSDSSGHKPYVFGSLDVVLIKIYNQPNLSGPFAISADGFISIPVVGDLKADGLTAKELREELTQRLKECCINNPEGEVDVQLGKNNSKRFYVIGGVGRPGDYPLDRDDLTVMEALSSVGGIHEFAKKNKIRILRGTKTMLFNYKDVSRGRRMDEDIVIQNGDRIFVDE